MFLLFLKKTKKKEITALFSDIENSTDIIEQHDPEKLIKQFSLYFETLSQIITQSEGTIDKFIGDAMMAFWGAPLKVKNPCHNAAIAALKAQRAIDRLNQNWLKQYKPVLNTRIGIHHGSAIVGNFGSSDRLNYTAIGHTINMANRLEGINKIYGTKIIVSQTVYALLKDDFLFRYLDYVYIRGQSSPMMIHELLGEKTDTLTFDLSTYEKTYQAGYNAYKARQWSQAIQAFRICLQLYPNDKASLVFIQRCEKFQIEDPPLNWEGIWHL